MPIHLSSLPMDEILRKRRGLRKRLLAENSVRKHLRIAVLGGTTTNELVELLELLLLERDFQPTFYQSEYGQYYEDAVLRPGELAAWNPDLIYIHTCARNVRGWPPMVCTEHELSGYLEAEMERWVSIWESLHEIVGCQIIQNNFEMPFQPMLGNLDGVVPGGRTRFLRELNRRFVKQAAGRPWLSLQDLAAIAGTVGLAAWNDPERWFSYKLANSAEGSFAIAQSLSAMVAALYGQTRKVLVLDLDNTLWGGVIGDDGVGKILIGKETPLAEAYTAFQEWCLRMRGRGVLLAVCSKNDEKVARTGFTHPDSVLKLEHFSVFRANWEPKHGSILAIAQELNLGMDSFVFIDDNPAERALVEAQLPGVAVPNIGSDVTRYAEIIERQRYFETLALGREDLGRSKLYEENTQRAKLQQRFVNYGEYLDSLEMTAEVESFSSMYLERIAQLTNKTNQFNLTTRRYTLAEIEAAANDPAKIALYGRLSDRFGDNGLISVVMGTTKGSELQIDLWLMSCRVLKREMEQVMLDALVQRARTAGARELIGQYLPTAKNGMVADHYEKLGFHLVSRDELSGATRWVLEIDSYKPGPRHIRILEPVAQR